MLSDCYVKQFHLAVYFVATFHGKEIIRKQDVSTI